MTELTNLTIRQAGELLASRAISATDLLEATLSRIAVTEPLIHAYALVMADEARAAARQADAELAQGRPRGPLHGIPVAVKDLCQIKGTPTEMGSRAFAGWTSAEDATVVRRLREAGAVIVGKTVTHELALGVNVPPTRNPWRLDCYPGGSSAGSGAAVAARSACGALGTDTGGSIREPASLHGLVGLKPTFGLVSRTGVFPLSPVLDHLGPLTRTVEDNALLLGAIAGYDQADTGSLNVASPDFCAELASGVAGLTIGVERTFLYGERVWDEVRVSVEEVIGELARLGARIVEVEIPVLDLMSTAGTTIILADAAALHGRLLRERMADIEPATRLLLEVGALIPASHYITAQRARLALRQTMLSVFDAQRLDVLLSPTLPTTTMPLDDAYREDETGTDPLTAAFNQMIVANLTGQPALTVPCGFSSNGLPIGFQLLGRACAEATLFRIARGYEREHDWFSRQPALAEVVEVS